MENKKEKVKLVAKSLFSKKGYKKVSMDELAKVSQVTKRTIYSYFKDKDDLFRTFIEEELIAMKEIIEKIEALDISFFDKVHMTIYQLLQYKKQSEFLNTISLEADQLKTDSVIHSIKVINDNIQNYIKEKLTAAISHGYIKECDVDFTAFLIYKLYIAMLFEWDNSKNLDEQQITDGITRILKTGIFN